MPKRAQDVLIWTLAIYKPGVTRDSLEDSGACPELDVELADAVIAIVQVKISDIFHFLLGFLLVFVLVAAASFTSLLSSSARRTIFLTQLIASLIFEAFSSFSRSLLRCCTLIAVRPRRFPFYHR